MEIRFYMPILVEQISQPHTSNSTYKRYNGGDWFSEMIQHKDNDESESNIILRTYTTLKTHMFKNGILCEILKKMPSDWVGSFPKGLQTYEPTALDWSPIEHGEVIGKFTVQILTSFESAQNQLKPYLDEECMTVFESLLQQVSEPMSSLVFQPHEQQVQKQHQPPYQQPHQQSSSVFLPHQQQRQKLSQQSQESHQGPYQQSLQHSSSVFLPHEQQRQKLSQQYQQCHQESSLKSLQQKKPQQQVQEQKKVYQKKFQQKPQQQIQVQVQVQEQKAPQQQNLSEIHQDVLVPREQHQPSSQERLAHLRKPPPHILGRLKSPQFLDS